MAEKLKRVDLAEVILWGQRIGAVAWDKRARLGVFEYEPDYVADGHPVAPLMLPLESGTHTFPELERKTYYGLPGMLADALPDRFGNALIDQWLARNGIPAENVTPIERLCYLGDRAMGALEFKPVLNGRRTKTSVPLQMSELVEQARKALTGNLADEPEDTLKSILSVGTSAGGQRAKAVIAWHPKTNEIRSGQLKAPAGFEHWLLKFDGVGKDEDLGSSQGYGRIEYAYHLMAKAAGIEMSQCRLLEENGRAHFMTRRFDRDGQGKHHMQSLCAIAHMDFNMKGAYGYEQLYQTTARLTGNDPDALEQLTLRMAFNAMARNNDDHTKNFAFLMDKTGRWSLSPAYDVTFAYKPGGEWTDSHQMSINGKREQITREDLVSAAIQYHKQPQPAIDRVAEAVSMWPRFAEEAGLRQEDIARIGQQHRRF